MADTDQKIEFHAADRVARTWLAPEFGRWEIRQRCSTAEEVEAAVAGGANGVEVESLDVLPDGFDFDAVAVSFAPSQSGDSAWESLDTGVRGCLGVDPIAATGDMGIADAAAMVSIATVSSQQLPGVRSVAVDARNADPMAELAQSMANAVRYLRAMTEGGLTVDEAAAEIEFTYSATVDQFETIAKLHAARALWHRVLLVCGATPTVQQQRAIADTDEDDPWQHQLKVTTAAFAAGAAGAQAISIAAFDTTGTDHDQALCNRVALNAHHLLLDESHMADAADPGAGSALIETKSDELARAAWAQFTELDGQVHQ